jgi:hypothetical protein
MSIDVAAVTDAIINALFEAKLISTPDEFGGPHAVVQAALEAALGKQP